MIISHQHRFIFFAVPKTATHAIRQALRIYKHADDWEQQVLFGEQVIPIPEIAELKHGHISARQIAAVLPTQQWQSYFKLAVVRNPFDRFVSACAFLNRGNPQFTTNPVAWMKAALQRQQFRERVLIRSQTQQLTDDRGELQMDYVGRYEELQLSLDYIFEVLNLPTQPLSIKNSSEHGHYREYYDDELHQQVATFYADDLALFNYQF